MVHVRQAEAGEVVLDIQMPSGYHYTEGAPSRWEVASQSEGLTLEPPRGTLRESGGPAAVLRFSRSASANTGNARVLARVYFCEDGGPCLLEEIVFQLSFVPFTSGPSPAPRSKVALSHRLSPRAAPANALTF